MLLVVYNLAISNKVNNNVFTNIAKYKWSWDHDSSGKYWTDLVNSKYDTLLVKLTVLGKLALNIPVNSKNINQTNIYINVILKVSTLV